MIAQGGAAPVGIFELLADAVLGIAEVEFGADFCVAQHRHHFLIFGHALAVEYGDDHRAGCGLVVELAEQRERGLQARDADGETGRRHRLAAEARDQAVVAPAAADRAEAHGAAFFVFGFERQFNFVDRAGVVLEAADDGFIDLDSILIPNLRNQATDFAQFSEPFLGCYSIHVLVV